MTHLRIEQSGQAIEAVSESLIKKLYDTALEIPEPELGEEDDAYMSGHISIPYTYKQYVEYLAGSIGEGTSGVVTSLTLNAEGRFLDLRIDVTNGYYIPFEDPNMISYLASMNIGTGGKVTEAEAAAVTVVSNARNSTITKFNELKYFTSITESKSGWTGTNSGNASFCYWTALLEIDISNFTSLGHNHSSAWEDTFANCTSLRKVTASDKLKKIGYFAFGSCSNLEEITGLSGTIEIYNNAFYGCTKLEDSSFLNCVFTWDNTRAAQNDYGKGAFRNCETLTTIALDPSITEMSSEVFYGCENLETVTGILNITDYSQGGLFRNCHNLEITVDLTNITKVGNRTFDLCGKINFIGDTSNIIMFSENAFCLCDLSNVTNLAVNVNTNDRIFYKATLPSTVTIGSLVTAFNAMFQEAKGEFSVLGGSGITSIGSSDFRSSEVSSILCPNVTSVGVDAFRECKKIVNTSDIGFWSSVLSIGETAFFKCSFAGAITLPNLLSIDAGAFNDCPNLTSVTFGGNTISNLHTNDMFRGCTSLTYVDLSGLLYMKPNFFRKCTSLQTVTGTSDIVYIGTECFVENATVTSGLYFPNCTTIESWAFGGLRNCPYIILSKLLSVPNRPFDTGTATIVDLGDQVLEVYAALNLDNSTNSYIIRSSSVPTMTGNFSNESWLKATVYVPRNLINTYKADANWGRILGSNGREVFSALEDSPYASTTWYLNI